MLREIVLDTETTGFEPKDGHRLVEIGCVEIINKLPTGRTYHQYINPERDMPTEAFNVHGISEEFLEDKPLFDSVADAFLEFIGKDVMVIHNAEFDMRFLNAELNWAGRVLLPMEQSLDTLAMARQKFPGSPANLDALCRRFNIDNSDRTYHGALLDSELLAEVYLELSGGRQHGLTLSDTSGKNALTASSEVANIQKQSREKRQFTLGKDEADAHIEMLESLTDPIWSNGS